MRNLISQSMLLAIAMMCEYGCGGADIRHDARTDSGVEIDGPVELGDGGVDAPPPGSNPARPVVFVDKITAPDGQFLDVFGACVAMSAQVLVIGVSKHDQTARDGGAVYVLEHRTGGWVPVSKLVPADAEQDDYFGWSVAVSRDYIVVGSPDDDERGDSSGSVYVFHRENGQWVEQAKLVAADGAAGDLFGHSVAINGAVIVVGARSADARGQDSGRAHVFEHQSGFWVETATLVASDSAAMDAFGHAVAVNGSSVFIGAPNHESGTGAVYRFERAVIDWTESGRIAALETAMGDSFGSSLATRGSSLVVGAMFARGKSSPAAGAAYVFEKDQAGTWKQTGTLVAQDSNSGDYFGISVSTTGNRVVVGALGHAALGYQAGAAYLFENISQADWQQTFKFLADDGNREDWFGKAVTIQDAWIAISAPYGDDAVMDSGSVYLYEIR